MYGMEWEGKEKILKNPMSWKQEKWNLLMVAFFLFFKKMKKMALYDMAKRKEKGISNGNNIIYNESKKMFRTYQKK